ncbi:MAG TPA: chromosomal replication initiator protein DnaA [Limnochordia bacterium]
MWSDILDTVRQQWGDASYDLWLRGSQPVRLDGKTLVVRFPTELARDWVAWRHSAELRRMLQDRLGFECHLELIVGSGHDSAPAKSAPRSGQGSLPLEPAANGRGPRRALNGQPATVRRVLEPAAGAPLNPRYTFDTFVVGSANRFAYAACLAVAERPAAVYNPLFIYGGVGLGKTHLMQAIGHYVRAAYPRLRVVYVSSETFTNDLVTAVQRRSMVDFRNKYRSVDILLIDDIQFVGGKESTQEEFFHTFNALHQSDKQIVLSSDRPPREISTLELRLRSRFEQGLTTDIQPPEFETRVAILRKKAETDDLRVPDEVLAFIAKNISSNIRELEGALIRIVAQSTLHNIPITLELAEKALRDLGVTAAARPITIERIQKLVAEHFGLRPEEMRTKKRTRSIAFARQVAMYLAREVTDASLPQIGEEFGGRDHSTVIHACDKIRAEIASDPALASTVRELTERLQQAP